MILARISQYAVEGVLLPVGANPAFNAEAAGDLAAIIYYKVSGEEPG